MSLKHRVDRIENGLYAVVGLQDAEARKVFLSLVLEFRFPELANLYAASGLTHAVRRGVYGLVTGTGVAV